MVKNSRRVTIMTIIILLHFWLSITLMVNIKANSNLWKDFIVMSGNVYRYINAYIDFGYIVNDWTSKFVDADSRRN